MRATILSWLRAADLLIRNVRRRLMPADMVAFEDVTAHWFTSALGTAVLLRLPSLVGEGQTIVAVAEASGFSAAELRRVLDVLVSQGYFRYEGDLVLPTRLSKALEGGRAGRFCELQSRSWYRDCFAPEVVVESLREGRTPYRHLSGEDFFQEFQQFPERAQLFSEAMAEITAFCGPLLVPSMRFEPLERVLDVGGGNGQFCRLLSESYPDTSFTTFDSCGGELLEGVERVDGCFMTEVPAGYDHLLLKNILHDWDDDKAALVLENCAQATEPGAHLSIVEIVLPEYPSGSDFGVDWNVLCTLGGKERRLEEYRLLLQRTGWELLEALPTGLPLGILRARRV